MTFGRDDEHDVEAAGGKTGQAVDARIVVAVFEAFVGGDWNAEQLCDLLLRIAKSFAFVAEAFSDFLTLFVEVVAMTAWLWSCWDAVQYNGIRKENGRAPPKAASR